MCVPGARSQQSTPDQGGSTPVAPEQPLTPENTAVSGNGNGAAAAPAGRALLGGGEADASQDSTETDQLPLSGAEQLMVPGAQPRNYFDASGLFSGSGDSGVINAQDAPTWGASEVVGGELAYNRSWGTDRFSLAYFGGGVLYQPSALYPASMFQTLSVGQQFNWKRLTLRLLDQFSYSPNSLFGGAGIGGPGLLAETGQTTSALNPVYGTNDTVLTGQSRLINNSAIAEIQYNFSPRASFTATGSAMLLDYVGGGYNSTHGYVGGAGYNYMITAKDTVAVTYSFTQNEYIGLAENLSFQQVNLAYARQVSGRLVFQISAGPELIAPHDYTPSVGSSLSWSLATSVQYRLQRTTFGANYSRGANAGSGVFVGATSQYVDATASHEFSRFLVGVVNVGYSLSNGLANEPGVSNQYHNWFTGLSLGRQLGRFAHVSFNYGAEQQPGSGVCPVTSCGTGLVVQTVGVSLDLHLHPLGPGE